MRLLMGLLLVGAVQAAPGDEKEAKSEKALAKVPGVIRLKDLVPDKSVYAKSRATKPLVLKTRKAAAEIFGKEEMAKLEKKVNFKHQIVLVFAWRGSGQDDLQLIVEESSPEKVQIAYQRGRTRDLRSHLQVYALRNDVTWKTK